MLINCSTNLTCLDGIEVAIVKYNKGIPIFKQPLISDEVKQILELCFHVTLFISTSIFGIVANVINITVYWRQTLKDSITLGFFTLSISDLFLVINSLITAFCYAAKAIFPKSNIDFPSIHYVSSGTLRNMGYSISSMLTAFLSLERCCCVVMPFKVKLIFTKSRTKVIFVSILLAHVMCYIPFFATQGLRWKNIPGGTVSGNSTTISSRYRLMVYFSEHRRDVEKISYILLGIVTPTLSQIIVTVCAVVLINGLRASSDFRQTMQMATVASAAAAATADAKRTPYLKDAAGDVNDGDAQKSRQEGPTSNGNAGGIGLNSRDARLVKAMFFLVVIFSTSNVPLLMLTYAHNIVPELNFGKLYSNTYSTSYSIVYVLTSVNASINIFVYYRTSSKYKAIFDSLVSCKTQ